MISSIKGYFPNFCYDPILINEIDKKSLLKIENVVSAIFIMENSGSTEYDKTINDLVNIKNKATLFEAKELRTWLF